MLRKILLEQNWWPQLLSSQLPGVSSDSVCAVWFKLYAYDWCKQLLLDWQYCELSGCHIDRNTNCHSVVLTSCLLTKLKWEDMRINLTRCSGKFRYRLPQNSQLCSSALCCDFIIHFRKKKAVVFESPLNKFLCKISVNVSNNFQRMHFS